MARNSYGGTTHSVVASGTNDPNTEVSLDAWNAEHTKSETGMLGFTKQSATISTNAIAVTGTLIEIQADGTLNTITPTDANEFDLIYLIAKSTATSVTITHDAGGGVGKIRLLSSANETLSTTSPLILMCRTISSVKEWVQYGGGVVNAINDIGDVNITSVANEDVLAYDSTTSKWINQSADESGRVTASSTNTFTNKTIDQDGTGNSITNIANASIKASAGIAYSKLTLTGAVTSNDLAGTIDATKIADGTVTSTEFQYINTLSSNAQTQLDAKAGLASSNTFTGATTAFGGSSSFSVTTPTITLGDASSDTINVLGTLTFSADTDVDLVDNNANAMSFDSTGKAGILNIVTTDSGEKVTMSGALDVTGTITGNLTGNVTGNTSGSSGSCTGNSATVTTNANLTGDVTSSGNATTIATDAVDIAMLSATGTASGTTFLRGDNTWATAGGGAGNTVDTKLRDEADTVPTYSSRTENDASTPIQLWAITLDSNNENIYVRVKKNGSYTNVQIA